MLKNLQRLLILISSIALLYILSQIFIVDDAVDILEQLRSAEIFSLEELQALQTDTESLQLGIVGINIVQGADSQKEWTLEAQWASYSDNNGNLTVHRPDIAFYSKKTAETDEQNLIKAKGEKGYLLDSNSLLILEEDVVIIQEPMQINTALVEYTTNDRVFVFPDSAIITSPTMQGTADIIHWDTINNRIQAKENVVIIFNNTNNNPTFD